MGEIGPLFPNSIVSNDLEFIRSSDKSMFAELVFAGVHRAEMPDKRHDALFDETAFSFSSQYLDGTTVTLWAHSDFSDQDTARGVVAPVAEAIGKLPTVMRARLSHVVTQNGDETAFGEAEGHFFVMYSDNIRARLRTHDLEETVFHEAVHATLDAQLLNSDNWLDAQSKDCSYVTEYAQNLPEKEDLAESALFAWALLVHPGRLPPELEAKLRDIMPNRLAFFEDLLADAPLFYNIDTGLAC